MHKTTRKTTEHAEAFIVEDDGWATAIVRRSDGRFAGSIAWTDDPEHVYQWTENTLKIVAGVAGADS